MAERATDVWRGALDANARYYEAWGRLAGDYVRELTEVLRGYAPKVTLPEITLPGVTVPTATAAASTAGPAPARPPAPSAPPTATAVVLEAPVGSTATGAVLVQNHLSHPVSAEVVASFPRDDGVDVEVDPRRVDLAPGEAAVVRVTATVPAAGEVRGELLVPELVGTAVPLVVRERAATGETSDRT
jgi:hypothetical protein